MDRVPNSVPARLKEVAAGDHPDPNLLAALAEQALPERERAQVLLHLSRCADCREVLALAIPPATTASPSLDTARRSWFQWPVLRWAAAAACVVIAGSAVLMKRGTMMSKPEWHNADSIVAMQDTREEVSDQLRSSALPKAPIQVNGTQGTESAPEQKLPRDAETKRAIPDGRTSQPRKTIPLMQPAPPPAPAAGVSGGIGGGFVGLKKPATRRDFVVAGHDSSQSFEYSADASTASPASATPESQKNLPIQNRNVNGLFAVQAGAAPAAPAQAAPQKETIEVQAASSAVEVQAASPAVQAQVVKETREKREVLGKAKASNPQLLDELQAKDQPQANNELVSDSDSADKAKMAKKAIHGSIPAYSPVSRWTISSDGQLQHSIDAGKTWQPVTVADNVAFRALSANGPDIWVGGAAGQLYHSPDSGSHWTQVKPESGSTALSGDIAAIEFTDVRQGKVTTAKGEVWLTNDGGTTWRKQP